MDIFLRYASEFENRIGVRQGFINELAHEDDWSFVIKLHAFIEACLTHAICSLLGYPELTDVIARLDTSNNQSGKLAFVRQLDMLNKSQRRFVSTLSQLRNGIVHDARRVDFSFKSHMENMEGDQRYQFCVALSLDDMFEPESEEGEFRLISLMDVAPKLGIGLSASVVVADLYLRTNVGDLNNEMKKIGERIMGLSRANSGGAL